jgi:hypothetical protein
MITVDSTAIRAWVVPARKRRRRKQSSGKPWRPTRFDERVLVFDTETTTNYTQRLLYGFYRLYVDDVLVEEKLVIADDLKGKDLLIASNFAQVVGLEVLTRTEFVESVFYPEVYMRGAMCVGYNLPFDLSRIAIGAGAGTGQNRRAFTLKLSPRIRFPKIRIESVSGRASFIGFAPKKFLAKWEHPFFRGRFLDLSTLAVAFTGEHHTLHSAAVAFEASVLKDDRPELGRVTPEALCYGRKDVEATWSLFERLREEYCTHAFASLENERQQPVDTLPITKIFSTASIAKQYLRIMGFRPHPEKQPRFPRKYYGYAAAAYYGGRAEVRVRRVDVPVVVLDATSMYPTLQLLQNLQSLMAATTIKVRNVTEQTQAFLDKISLDDLFDPTLWPQLTRLVRLRPDGDILPVRFRLQPDDKRRQPTPYSISVTKFTSTKDHYYTLADVVAAIFLGHKVPRILEALEFYADGADRLNSVDFQGRLRIDPRRQVFKQIVEERQRTKRAKGSGGDPSLSRMDLGLKTFANSGAYGINFEVNVTPSPQSGAVRGNVYADGQYGCDDVHDERPGTFCNPIIASFVTGAARLLLAMLETEVSARGGTFAFCDTDSLAIVCGEDCPPEIPSLDRAAVNETIAKFDALSPYDPTLVKHMLKHEHEEIHRLRCWAVSAKRYVLFEVLSGRKIRIVKASESGLGGIIGRTDDENTHKLAVNIWTHILRSELPEKYIYPNISSSESEINYRDAVRRKIPLSQPHILKNPGFRAFNRKRDYRDQIKPFGFIQSVVPAVEIDRSVQPIAPYERDAVKSRSLPWVDLRTGDSVQLDWLGTGERAVPVYTMDEYIQNYRTHPERKAADQFGNPSGSETRGLLHRLHVYSDEPVRIGKEVDRLDEVDGMPQDDGPVEYAAEKNHRRSTTSQFRQSVEKLRPYRPRRELAHILGITERRLRDISKRGVIPHKPLQGRIIAFAHSWHP